MTQKEKYEMIINKLGLKEYYDKGFHGQGVKIASVESLKSEHGKKVYLTLKTYCEKAEVISFDDEYGISATGDQNTPDTINFPKFVSYCLENKVDIVTSSLNWQADEEIEKEAIKKLYEHGIIFLNCTPNKDITVTVGESDRACCIDKEVVGVSGLAMDIKGKLTWCDFANGNAVDVVSISENLPILYDADKFMSWSGNSAGTPLIAAMFAVLKSSGFKVNSKNVIDVIGKYSNDFDFEGMTYNHFIMPPIVSFTDIEEDTKNEISLYEEPSEWAKSSWVKAYEKGVLDGSNPQGNMTREMFAVVLDRLGLLK